MAIDIDRFEVTTATRSAIVRQACQRDRPLILAPLDPSPVAGTWVRGGRRGGGGGGGGGVVLGNDTKHLGIATDYSYVAPATVDVAVTVPVFPLGDTHTLCTHPQLFFTCTSLVRAPLLRPVQVPHQHHDYRPGRHCRRHLPRAVWRAGLETVSQL